MGTAPIQLADEAARRTAMSDHDRSLLVEAGAGTGKTAIMAGRIAMMLAAGTKPRAVAAIAFTELASSELLERIQVFVEALLAGQVPSELRPVLTGGLDETQKANLSRANTELDEITCTTIHGFCQRLIKPYPVEAKIDPGAAVMDPAEADRLFAELRDDWLRECLDRADGALIAEMVTADPKEAVAELLNLRRGITVSAVAAQEGIRDSRASRMA